MSSSSILPSDDRKENRSFFLSHIVNLSIWGLLVFCGVAAIVIMAALVMHAGVCAGDKDRYPFLAFALDDWLIKIVRNVRGTFPTGLVANTLSELVVEARTILGAASVTAQRQYLEAELGISGWRHVMTYTSTSTASTETCAINITLANGRVVYAAATPASFSDGTGAYSVGRSCQPGLWHNVTVKTDCVVPSNAAGGLFVAMATNPACSNAPTSLSAPATNGTVVVLFPQELYAARTHFWPSLDVVGIPFRSSYAEEFLSGPLQRVEVVRTSVSLPQVNVTGRLLAIPPMTNGPWTPPTPADVAAAPSVLLVLYEPLTGSQEDALRTAAPFAQAAAVARLVELRRKDFAAHLFLLVVHGRDVGALFQTTALRNIAPSFARVIELFGSGGENAVPVVLHPVAFSNDDKNAINAHIEFETPVYIASDRFPSMLPWNGMGTTKWLGVTSYLPLLGSAGARRVSSVTNAVDVMLGSVEYATDTTYAAVIAALLIGAS